MPSYLSKNINWRELSSEARASSCFPSEQSESPEKKPTVTTPHAEFSPLKNSEDINQEIDIIDQEIVQCWVKFPASENAFDEFMHDSLIAFLLRKKVYLQNLRLKADEMVNEKPITIETYRQELFSIIDKKRIELQEPPKKKKSKLQVVFDIGKKIIDLLDDAWDAVRSELSPNDSSPIMTGILSGGVSFIIFLGEGIIAAKEARDVYYSTTGQRKTKIAANVMSFLIAGAGAGLALALFASTVGASVAGAPLFVVLLPALLGAIYSMALWKKLYIFHEAKNAFNEAVKKYEDCLKKFNDLKFACKNEKDITKKQSLEKKLQHLKSELSFLEQSKELANEKRFYAKKQAAYTAVEITCLSFTLVGTILSVGASIGLGAATFGALPLALIVIGVVSGMVLKFLEHKDENTRYQHTDSFWPWIMEQGNKIKNIFSPSKNNKRDPSLTDKMTKGTRVNLIRESQNNLPAPTATLKLRSVISSDNKSLSQQAKRATLPTEAHDAKARATFSFFKFCQPCRKQIPTQVLPASRNLTL